MYKPVHSASSISPQCLSNIKRVNVTSIATQEDTQPRHSNSAPSAVQSQQLVYAQRQYAQSIYTYAYIDCAYCLSVCLTISNLCRLTQGRRAYRRSTLRFPPFDRFHFDMQNVCRARAVAFVFPHSDKEQIKRFTCL